jgi:hypothetical protein
MPLTEGGAICFTLSVASLTGLHGVVALTGLKFALYGLLSDFPISGILHTTTELMESQALFGR